MAFTQRTGRMLGFTHKSTVADGATEVLLVPPLDSGAHVSVSAIPGANTALVEFTTTPDADVAASGVWQEWPDGSVTSTTSNKVMSPITGLRFSATGGDCSFEVVM